MYLILLITKKRKEIGKNIDSGKMEKVGGFIIAKNKKKQWVGLKQVLMLSLLLLIYTWTVQQQKIYTKKPF